MSNESYVEGNELPIGIGDVLAAQDRISGHSVVTPLLQSIDLNARTGGRIFIKAEVLQRTGSFKFRGALNRLSTLNAAERRRGVVAYSSGNHAQAVALAAKVVGTHAVIVMPEDAPHTKIAKTKTYGGEVVTYDRYREDRLAIVAQLASSRGLTVVPPYDDLAVITGQGTLALEILEQLPDVQLDAMLVSCSGGGLVAGCALAFAAKSPTTAIHTVEPEGFDDTALSLQQGLRVANLPGQRSICDAILVNTPGEITFSINRRLLAGGLTVTDAETKRAMAYAFDELKIVVEPGGAVALAAILAGKFDCHRKSVVVVCSGGNVDASLFADVLENERLT